MANGFAPVRRRLAQALLARGFEVLEAVNLVEALRVMSSRGIPGSFVVDEHLAGGQGISFAQRLGTLEKTRACPVVLLVDDLALLDQIPHAPLHDAVEPVVRLPLLDQLVTNVIEALTRGLSRSEVPESAGPVPIDDHTGEVAALDDAFRLFRRVVDMVRDNKLPGPIIPELLRDVMTLLGDPDIALSSLVQFIGRHQTLAVRILTMANSAFYLRAGARVTSLQIGIARLGQRQTARLLQSAAARGFAVGNDPVLKRLIIDSLDMGYVVALAADSLARLGWPPHQGDVYTIGLFHNIGQTFLYYACALLREQQKLGAVDVDSLKTLAASRAADLNELMCEQMRLPWELVAIYASARRPEVSEATVTVIHQAMWVGDRLLRHRSVADLELDAEGEMLGLTVETVDRVREFAPQLLSLLQACQS